MSESELAERLLRHVHHPNYRPVKPRVIAKQLKLDDAQTSELKRELKRLVKRGLLVYGSNHLVGPGSWSPGGAKPGRAGETTGTFQRAMAGYGFVRPLGTPRAAGRDRDIFIPASKTADAANGDLVRVRLSRQRSREGGSRLSGEVVTILERSRSQFVGSYFERGESGWVQLDGTDFSTPVQVGDPGAKGVQAGDKVVIELLRYPTPTQPGTGVITEVLGERGAPGVDTRIVLREFSLPDRFPEDVLEAARLEAERLSGAIEDGRQDLTGLVVITIDPVDARDFDDAISLERLPNGHWRLGVHIADVSHFVRPRTPLDREARERATSVYLPDRVIPMLPEVVSNHLASLQPNEVRYVQTAFIEYTAEGQRVATDFCTGAIRSRRRMTYEEVDEFLLDKPMWHVRLGADVFRLLDDMVRLARILRQRRLAHGSIELNLPEVKIELDRDGRVCGARRLERTESHQVIEEFMLAANEAVAERLSDGQVPFLRRIHAAPDPTRMETLTEFVRELGLECESLENRFEIKRILSEVAGQPIEQAVNYAVLRAMSKAVYGPDEEGHYALAIKDYCHFTSPIRRYPDLTIHRLMRAIFQGARPESAVDQLITLGDHCSQREQRAEAAERELIKLKLLNFLADKVGQSLDVVVTGVEEFGLFVQGLTLPAEGLIHVTTLGDDRYTYDGQVHALVGRRADNTFRLGDLLRAEIAAVDLNRRELDFVMRERLPSGTAGAPFRPRAAGSGGDTGERPADARPSGRTKQNEKRSGAGRGGKPPDARRQKKGRDR